MTTTGLPTIAIVTDAAGTDVHTGRCLASGCGGITVAAPAPRYFRDFRYADGYTVRFVTRGAA